jgi:hypothetical protein
MTAAASPHHKPVLAMPHVPPDASGDSTLKVSEAHLTS